VGRLIPAAPKSSERRRRWQDAAFAALDFEATSLDFTRDRIISFGVVPIDGGRVETDGAVYELVDPGPVMFPRRGWLFMVCDQKISEERTRQRPLARRSV
jgi:DNA polymerase III epsilon subunit-like protein